MPKALLSHINLFMQKFWWGHQKKASGIPWMSWSRMGLSKAYEGMGFRDFHCFNRTLLAKQYWRLWQMPDSLIASIIMAKYFPNCNAIEA